MEDDEEKKLTKLTTDFHASFRTVSRSTVVCGGRNGTAVEVKARKGRQNNKNSQQTQTKKRIRNKNENRTNT